MIHIVVPLGGEGKRFAERGYSFPKPLVEIVGKPMIEVVVHNLTPTESHQFIFVCRQEHLERFALSEVLVLIAPESEIVSIRNPTAGALCSVLLGMEYLQHDEELLVANADQYVDVTIDEFLTAARGGMWDGYLMTFPATHPKWSYAKVEDDAVVAVAEKRPISRNATVGLYYFRSGRDFLAAAERMLLKNATVGGEFYVAPLYNELILMGKRIGIYPIAREQMHSLGTPEDVENFTATQAHVLNW
jgi:NDP-sugar pyrophosphorylase family protein